MWYTASAWFLGLLCGTHRWWTLCRCFHTHCWRELMHAVWAILLDDDFLYAYEHRIIILCPDDRSRRFFPRIFTYLANYPEKWAYKIFWSWQLLWWSPCNRALLATIRNFGSCPCPQCLVPKSKIPEAGTAFDKWQHEKSRHVDNLNRNWNVSLVRDFIYERGFRVRSAAVEHLLAEESYTPTKVRHLTFKDSQILNPCISECIFITWSFSFNFFDMLVPDFMHEFELNIWKALFTHLVHILVSQGDSTIQEFNRWYRQVPTFGRSTIRHFSENASGMKKLAARNFEDLLQVHLWITFDGVQKCAMPVFDGLLPANHNNNIQSLLFTTAEWHTLVKMHLCTDSTLTWLDESTKAFGKQIRRFQSHTCSFFDTWELPQEEAASSWHQKKRRKCQ